jgi:hypothetical protein
VVVDWVIRKATQDRTGLQRNLFTKLENLEFADDTCLISEKATAFAAENHKSSKWSKEGRIEHQ